MINRKYIIELLKEIDNEINKEYFDYEYCIPLEDDKFNNKIER